MRLEFSIYRYNPEVDDKPRMQEYTLESEDGRDMMLLDALIRLKEKDPTLAFRRSCREGVCGSDGLNMNGKKKATKAKAAKKPALLQRCGPFVVFTKMGGMWDKGNYRLLFSRSL